LEPVPEDAPAEEPTEETPVETEPVETEPTAEEAPEVEEATPAEPEEEAESTPDETPMTPAPETSSPEKSEETTEEAPASITKPKPKPKRKKKVEEVKIVLDHDPKEMLEKDLKGNKMRQLRIEKVVVNIGVGEAGDKLQRAEKVLEILTGQNPKRTLSRTTNRDFGIRKAMPIGCVVTLRDEPAEKFLKDAFWVKENRIAGYSFDREGNFSFGIPDYTSFPNQKYDPDIGIFGMDICVTMKRAGRRVRRRKHARGHIPHRHRLNPELVKDFLRVNFDIEVVEE
jgi:large subunit ribosomal protein L5